MLPNRSWPKVATAEQQDQAEDFFNKWVQATEETDEFLTKAEILDRASSSSGSEINAQDPPNFFLRQLYSAVELSLQSLLWSRSKAEIENIVNDLLLLDYRVEKATTEEEKQKALEVLKPAHKNLGKSLRLLNEDSFDSGIESLYLKLGPLLSQVPLRIRNRIYALVRIEKDDFKIKLSFRDDTPPAEVADRVCKEMAATGRFTNTLTEEAVREAVLNVLGPAPPYSAVPLMNPRLDVDAQTFEEPSGDELEEDSEEAEISYTDIPSQRKLALTCHEDHIPGEVNRMCLDCYRVREEVQEDMITALAESTERLEAHNNTLIREIFNPL